MLQPSAAGVEGCLKLASGLTEAAHWRNALAFPCWPRGGKWGITAMARRGRELISTAFRGSPPQAWPDTLP